MFRFDKIDMLREASRKRISWRLWPLWPWYVFLLARAQTHKDQCCAAIQPIQPIQPNSLEEHYGRH